MFNRLSFKGQPDTFSLTLDYRQEDGKEHADDGFVVKGSTTVHWLSSDTESEILERVTAAANDPEIQKERVEVQLRPEGASGFWGVVSAASAHHDVQLGLKIQTTRPSLQSIEMVRSAGGTISTSLGMGIWRALDLQHVTRLRCNEGTGSLWDRSLLERFSSLRVLNLSHANLSTLPGVIGTLTSLQELRLVGNHLKILPAEIGKLQNLRVLAVDSNELAILPGELKKCTALEEFTLENNRLTSVLLNFGSLRKLRVLHLCGNPLEFLPEISPCQELRNLSVATLRVHADHEYKEFHVELLAPVAPSSSINISLFDSKPNDKLRPIFGLMLRRSSGHHPLLAGAFRHLAEDPKTRELMSKQENALQQLILMALNDDSIVVDQTCKTLALLAQHSSSLANAILDVDLGSLKSLLRSDDPIKQLACLSLIAAISVSLGDIPNRLLSADILGYILSIIDDRESSQELRAAALIALGDLGFSPEGKAQLSADTKIMDTILRLAEGGQQPQLGLGTVPLRVKSAAVRALAILGDNLAVGRAVGRLLPKNRGLRILSMDGGGMKGMATVRLLRQLEARTGRPIHDLFDLIVGTSTGGLLAVAVGLRKFSLDECEHIYKVLGQRVFSRPTANKEKDETWMEAFYRTFHSKTQHVRAVVVGYKHDASVYETLLKEYCSFVQDPRCPSDSLIDTACLDVPKVALVATRASACPAMPFVFRNYELPLATAADREKICFQEGSSKYKVWQAVRASSAAIYYLDDFSCGGEKFQDGAVVANNPSVVALQEARALWPDAPIDVFISIGTGSTPLARRDKAVSSFIDTGNIVIESATNVERVHEALATMTPLMPNFKYFRFNPLDPRCSMELDEIDPEKWTLLEQATDDFISENGEELDAAAAALLRGLGLPARASSSAKLAEAAGARKALIKLRLHRGLWVCTSIPSAIEPTAAEVAAAACARLDGCSGALDLQSWTPSKQKQPATQGADLKSVSKRKEVAVLSSPISPSVLPISQSAGGAQAPDQPQGPAVVEVNIGSALGSVFGWFSSPAKPSSGPEQNLPATPPGPVGKLGPDSSSNAAATTPPPRSAPRISPSPLSHPIALTAGGDTPVPKSKATSKSKQPVSSSSGGDLLPVVQESIQNASSPVGIILIALRSCVHGLVMRWTDTFAAVTEPSVEAEDIIRRAGFDPATTSLADILEHGGGEVVIDGVSMRAVSKQYRRLVTGQLASVILLQCRTPVEVLDPMGIGKLRHSVEGKVVLCSEPLPASCLDAFAAAGALGVLAPKSPLSDCAGASSAALGAFWTGIISDLQEGGDLEAAIKRAEDARPVLRGQFKLHAQRHN